MRKKNSKFTRPSETDFFFCALEIPSHSHRALSFIWVREAGNCTENNAEISLNMIYWCCLLFDFAASTLRSSLDNFIALLLIRSERVCQRKTLTAQQKCHWSLYDEMKWFIIIFVIDSAEFCCWFFCVSREHINFGNQIFFSHNESNSLAHFPPDSKSSRCVAARTVHMKLLSERNFCPFILSELLWTRTAKLAQHAHQQKRATALSDDNWGNFHFYPEFLQF